MKKTAMMEALNTTKERFTLEELMNAFGLTENDVDVERGLIPIFNPPGTFVFNVTQEASSRIKSTGDWKIKGPYEDANISIPEERLLDGPQM